VGVVITGNYNFAGARFKRRRSCVAVSSTKASQLIRRRTSGTCFVDEFCTRIRLISFVDESAARRREVRGVLQLKAHD
jgi:hypothetical protein